MPNCNHGVLSAIKINASDYKIICSNCNTPLCVSRDLDYVDEKTGYDIEYEDYKNDND
jgi:hypothetical protein